MPWVRLDDHFDEHPKFEAAGPLAGWLFVVGLAYAGRNLTDGFIPKRAVARLANWEGIGVSSHGELFGIGHDVAELDLPGQLVALGLWEEAEGGYRIHDYLEYQPSKAQVLAERERGRQRQATWRERHSASNDSSNAGSNAVINASVTVAPYPVPVPYPEEIKSKDTGVVVVVPAPNGATTTPVRPREAIAFQQLSPDAQAVVTGWREAFGKRAPPKLNPTQVAKLEAAVADLGVPRLLESAEWCAGKGLTEFPKTLSAAYTKRQRDEAEGYRNGSANGASGHSSAIAKYDN